MGVTGATEIVLGEMTIRCDEHGKQNEIFEVNCCGRLPTTTGTLGKIIQEKGETNTEREAEGTVVEPLWLEL